MQKSNTVSLYVLIQITHNLDNTNMAVTMYQWHYTISNINCLRLKLTDSRSGYTYLKRCT